MRYSRALFCFVFSAITVRSTVLVHYSRTSHFWDLALRVLSWELASREYKCYETRASLRLAPCCVVCYSTVRYVASRGSSIVFQLNINMQWTEATITYR